jgi:hypothetical protein
VGLLVLVGMVAAAAGISGCSSPSSHRASETTTTLLQVDDWKAPAATGGPSQANFCRVLIAMYRHEAELPRAAPRAKEQIVADFVATVPEAESVAPPPVAAAARTYLTAVTAILQALERAGLDYTKIKPGTLTPLLLDPSIKAAGNQVLTYSQTQCHYPIGGA